MVAKSLTDRVHARKRTHQFPEPGAAHLEIGVLVERRTGGGQQDHGLFEAGLFGVARGLLHRSIEGFGHLMGDVAVERDGELRRRLADQVGLADAREEA
jgi:hypothetical protein